jgi:hypothetical protein
MIGYRKYWYGKEIEGRLTGIETAFIYDMSVFENDDHPYNRVFSKPHIYFCKNAVKQLLERDEFVIEMQDVIAMIVDRDKIVTLEVDNELLKQLPPVAKIKCHLMYMIEDEGISDLKMTDSVKVQYKPYHLICATVENFQHVNKEDYQYDHV